MSGASVTDLPVFRRTNFWPGSLAILPDGRTGRVRDRQQVFGLAGIHPIEDTTIVIVDGIAVAVETRRLSKPAVTP